MVNFPWWVFTYGFFLNCFISTFSLLHLGLSDKQGADYATQCFYFVKRLPVRADVLLSNQAPATNTLFVESMFAFQLMNRFIENHSLLRIVNQRTSCLSCCWSTNSANMVSKMFVGKSISRVVSDCCCHSIRTNLHQISSQYAVDIKAFKLMDLRWSCSTCSWILLTQSKVRSWGTIRQPAWLRRRIQTSWQCRRMSTSLCSNQPFQQQRNSYKRRWTTCKQGEES